MTGTGKSAESDGAAVLPDELTQLLNRDSYSLLIKGSVGTGKTILALTLLKTLRIKTNYLYLSTKSSPSQLFEYHPWLGGFLDIPHSAQARKHSDLADSMKRFVDARLDEPTQFLERITNELMDVQSPMIIIDTWDSIGKMMEPEALATNARVLQTWRERADAKLILISGEPDDKIFDSLVDGIVLLNRTYLNGRIVRTIGLSKLKGIKVSRPSRIFTLNNGIFHSFDGYRPFELGLGETSLTGIVAKTGEARAAGPSTSLRTGYRELDTVLGGGLPAGTIISIELDPFVNASFAFMLLGRMLARPASTGAHILLRPFEGLSASYLGITSMAAPTGPGSKRGRSVPGESSEKSRSNRGLGGAPLPFKREVMSAKAAHPLSPVIAVVGDDLGPGTAEGGEHIGELAQFMRSNIAMTVIITRGEEQTRRGVGGMADVSLRIFEIEGTPVLEPRVPWTEFYAFAPGGRRKDAPFTLVPLV